MRKKGTIFVCLCLLVFVACKPKTEYQKMLDAGLASGIEYDSLFAGIHFKMTKKEFFDYCWEQNKKGTFINGTSNQVVYDVSDDFSRPTRLQFYPKYTGGFMVEMPMEFQYKDWALWNKETKVELLLDEVKSVMMQWYGGNDFLEMTSDDGLTTVYVKVDGDRQIRVGKINVSTVKVDITNLTNLNKTNEKS